MDVQPIDLDDLRRVSVKVREKTDDNWLADMVELACDEIARLREERLTNEEVGAICWARAGLLADSDETKARGLRERSEHSREAAETLTRLLERQPLPTGLEGDG
jgi:hypothetical protein